MLSHICQTSIEGTTPGGNPNVNYGLWIIKKKTKLRGQGGSLWRKTEKKKNIVI